MFTKGSNDKFQKKNVKGEEKMALTEKKKNEWIDALRELGLLGATETFEEHTQGDYWTLFGQTRGNYFFTADKIIFVSGFGAEQIVIPYSNIKAMKKCFVGPFIPTGIKITALNENGKEKNYKLSVMKRNDWINFISQKSGVSCQ